MGLEKAGFDALAHLEIDPHACGTLRVNRPKWRVIEGDVRQFSAAEFKGVDFPEKPHSQGNSARLITAPLDRR